MGIAPCTWAIPEDKAEVRNNQILRCSRDATLRSGLFLSVDTHLPHYDIA
jgi:hypothetical protein